jgi:hypothetical protein
VQQITEKYKDRCIEDKVMPKSYWNKKRTAANADGNNAGSEPVLA